MLICPVHCYIKILSQLNFMTMDNWWYATIINYYTHSDITPLILPRVKWYIMNQFTCESTKIKTVCIATVS